MRAAAFVSLTRVSDSRLCNFPRVFFKRLKEVERVEQRLRPEGMVGDPFIPPQMLLDSIWHAWRWGQAQGFHRRVGVSLPPPPPKWGRALQTFPIPPTPPLRPGLLDGTEPLAHPHMRRGWKPSRPTVPRQAPDRKCVERELVEHNKALDRRRSWWWWWFSTFLRGTMAILFAVVARGTTILAKNALCGGNFLEVTEQILAKIPSENNKLTYSHGNYLFHYICQDRIIYLCITDDDFERSRAFTFLNEIKKRFQTTYGSRAQTALPYAMNSEFSSVLAAQMKHLSENKNSDPILETQTQVDELKGIMVRNIELVAQRGEKLELLIDKTDNLVDSSVTFKTTSRNLARAMCMKNLKLTIVVVIVAIVVIYIIVSAACGGLLWPTCIKK